MFTILFYADVSVKSQIQTSERILCLNDVNIIDIMYVVYSFNIFINKNRSQIVMLQMVCSKLSKKLSNFYFSGTQSQLPKKLINCIYKYRF